MNVYIYIYFRGKKLFYKPASKYHSQIALFKFCNSQFDFQLELKVCNFILKIGL